MKKIIVFFCLLGISGCGTGESSAGDYSAKVVSAYQDLPTCNDGRRGHLYYVESTTAFFTCKSGGWQTVNVGNSVYGKIGCMQSMNNIVLTYEAVIFKNGDSFTNCEVFDATSRTQSNYSEYHSYNSSAGKRLECNVGHLTSSGGGFYTITVDSAGVISVNYENYTSGSNSTHIYTPSSCVSNTYE